MCVCLSVVRNEIQVMSVSNHPNIVEYIEAYQWGGKGGASTKVLKASSKCLHRFGDCEGGARKRAVALGSWRSGPGKKGMTTDVLMATGIEMIN